MFSIEKLKERSATEERVKIMPKVQPPTTPAEKRREVAKVAKQVIMEHREVFVALKNR